MILLVNHSVRDMHGVSCTRFLIIIGQTDRPKVSKIRYYRPMVSGLPPSAFGRGPVPQPDHGGVELLDCGRVQFFPGIVEVIPGLDQVSQGGIDNIGIRRVVSRTGSNNRLRLFEQPLSFVSQPDRRSLCRTHRTLFFVSEILECYPKNGV